MKIELKLIGEKVEKLDEKFELQLILGVAWLILITFFFEKLQSAGFIDRLLKV